MAVAAAMAEKRNKGTPGRPKKKGNQYWDIGKVGRKTGITLEDKGVRDEHGLEPMEHIFSSPVRRVDGAGESSETTMPESSGPDLDITLASRKTPRLPPPRASTPKYTNIGSPKRMSTGRASPQRASEDVERDESPTRSRTQPPANRVLDFGADKIHRSIESPSPFKPRHALRRSIGQQDPFASPTRRQEPITEVIGDDTEVHELPLAEERVEDHELPPIDETPIMIDDDDDYYAPMPDPPSVEIDPGEVEVTNKSPLNVKTARNRKSDVSTSSSHAQRSPHTVRSSASKKRDRSVLEEDNDEAEPEQDMSPPQPSESARAQKKQRGRTPKTNEVIIHHRNGEDETIDPALLARGDAFEVDTSLEAVLTQPNKGKGNGKGKGKKGKALKDKDRNQILRAPGSPVKLNDSPSKLRNSRDTSRPSSAGPTNNYHLRATTPFEDAGERVSRFGRNLIQPLKYWANESRIYKFGRIEGIVRAEEVEKPKVHRPKKKKKQRATKLGDIEEEISDSESVMPDEWEDEVGVIGGMVANWDPEMQAGVPEDLIREDLAFASSSIVTREVANSDFRYAKIMTLPFFGSGVVELPPEGTKRVKNSRKMQMCFFVHEGKVMVEVGAAGAADVTQFAISKGGVWVVPRGNNYAITNESKTRTARIFFAQGCEVEALAASAVPETAQ